MRCGWKPTGTVSGLRWPIIIPSVTYVGLGQQAGAEFHVVLQVEGPGHLKLVAEGVERGRLIELLHAANTPELLLGVLRDGQSGRSPVAATMVVVVRRAGDRRGGVGVLAELVV